MGPSTLGWRAETRLDPDVMESFRRDCFLFFCGGTPPFGGGNFLDVALGDLDEDSDLDAVYGLESGRVLWDRNTVGDGSRWPAMRSITWPIGSRRLPSDHRPRLRQRHRDRDRRWRDLDLPNDGSQSRTLIHTNQNDVRSLRVADMDGDFWDDIVIATEDGYIRWYRHDNGLAWNIIVIEQLGTRIYNIGVGDVDRGVVIDPSL